MDPRTGEIYSVVPDDQIFKALAVKQSDLNAALRKAGREISESEARERGLVPVTRDLTAKEQADWQIRLYSPCACGSGKKFKFCCKAK